MGYCEDVTVFGSGSSGLKHGVVEEAENVLTKKISICGNQVSKILTVSGFAIVS